MASAIAILALVLGQDLRGTASIEGVVRDAQSKVGIRRAVVTLELGGADGATATAVTDDEGRFAFRELPAGDYRLTAQKAGYGGSRFGRPAIQRTRSVTLREGESAAGVLVSLDRDAVLSGMVRDAEGQPATRAIVELLASDRMDGTEKWSYARSNEVNDRGEFRIFGIPAGTYILKAHPPQTFQNPQAKGLRPVFYPSALDEESAAKIEIRAGEELSGFELQLRAARLAEVLVQVILPDGMDANRSAALSIEAENWAAYRSVSPGQWHKLSDLFPDVKPGTYTIRGVTEGASRTFGVSQTLKVEEGSEQRLILRPEPGFDVPCVVKTEGRAAQREFRIAARQSSMNTPPQWKWRQGTACVLKDVTPGALRLDVDPLGPDFYLRDLRIGDQSFLAKSGVPERLELMRRRTSHWRSSLARPALFKGSLSAGPEARLPPKWWWWPKWMDLPGAQWPPIRQASSR